MEWLSSFLQTLNLSDQFHLLRKFSAGLVLSSLYYLYCKHWPVRLQNVLKHKERTFVFKHEGLKIITSIQDCSKHVIHQTTSASASLTSSFFGTPSHSECLEIIEVLRRVLRTTETTLIAADTQASEHLQRSNLAEQRFLAESRLRQEAEAALEMEKEIRKKLEQQVYELKKILNKTNDDDFVFELPDKTREIPTPLISIEPIMKESELMKFVSLSRKRVEAEIQSPLPESFSYEQTEEKIKIESVHPLELNYPVSSTMQMATTTTTEDISAVQPIEPDWPVSGYYHYVGLQAK